MAECEVKSPVSIKGSKVGSGQPLSPGARSNPGRVGGPRFDSVMPQPSSSSSRHNELPAASLGIVGPED